MSVSNDNLIEETSFGSIADYFSSCGKAWNRFWFTPRDPFVLGIMRVLVGLIVFYTHLVWTLELSTFLGADGLLPTEYRQLLFGNSFAWSHLDLASTSSFLMAIHVVGLIVVAMFTFGIWSRWTGVATALLVISYANRGTGALFGLDQINAFLCLYLAIGNSGGAFSIDAWRAIRRGDVPQPGDPIHTKSDSEATGAGQGSRIESRACVWTNIATRLIQTHLCVVYLFAAIGKLQGESWFTGEAVWRALASYEYQTLDMTWLADHMWLVALMTLAAVGWELAYPALIWPKLTRPLVLALVIPIHLGIGICMGMMTFGLIMIVGNLAFIEPQWLGRLKRTIDS